MTSSTPEFNFSIHSPEWVPAVGPVGTMEKEIIAKNSGGDQVGRLLINKDIEGRIDIAFLDVKNSEQRKGIASRLLDQAFIETGVDHLMFSTGSTGDGGALISKYGEGSRDGRRVVERPARLNTKTVQFDFEHGDCAAYAIALHRLTGFELKAVMDFDDELNSKVLVHAYVHVPGVEYPIWDACGLSNLNWVLDKYPNSEDAAEVSISEQDLLAIAYQPNQYPDIEQVITFAKKVIEDLGDEVIPRPYAILIAAVTGTNPWDWSNLEVFETDFEGNTSNIDEAEHRGASCGDGIFAKMFMVHKDGREADVQYAIDDDVFVNCGDIRWLGPLEDPVHWNAVDDLNYEGARNAYLSEMAQKDEPAGRKMRP